MKRVNQSSIKTPTKPRKWEIYRLCPVFICYGLVRSERYSSAATAGLFSGPSFFLQAAVICLLSRSSEIRLAGAGIALLRSLSKYARSERCLAVCNEMS